MSIYFLIVKKKEENEKEKEKEKERKWKKRKKVQSSVSINSKTFEGDADEVWGRNYFGHKWGKWKSRVLMSKLLNLGELLNLKISFDIP